MSEWRWRRKLNQVGRPSIGPLAALEREERKP
jgi:hypothetical protein